VTNSIFAAAEQILLEASPAYREDGKFELTPKIQELLGDLADQVSFRIDTEQQIKALTKDLEKIEKTAASIEAKYWKEVDKFGFNPRNVAAPAHNALNKVRDSKK
jgi:hypothetical protein